jgi:hypothetical protein
LAKQKRKSEWLTIKEAARRPFKVGVYFTVRSIQRWAQRGLIQAKRDNRGRWLVLVRPTRSTCNTSSGVWDFIPSIWRK